MRFYEMAANREHDEAVIAEDMVYHGPPMIGVLQGRAAFVQVLEGFSQALPGFETDVTLLMAEGDLVAVHHTHRGTPQAC